MELYQTEANCLQIMSKSKKVPFDKMDLISKCSSVAEAKGMTYGQFMAWCEQNYGSEKKFFGIVTIIEKSARTKNCAMCGKEFYPRKANERYCSVECWDDARLQRNAYRKAQRARLREFELVKRSSRRT